MKKPENYRNSLGIGWELMETSWKDETEKVLPMLFWAKPNVQANKGSAGSQLSFSRIFSVPKEFHLDKLVLDFQSAFCTVVLNKRMYSLWSMEKYRNPPTECVTNDPKLVPTIQCQAGPYTPSNSWKITTPNNNYYWIHPKINQNSTLTSKLKFFLNSFVRYTY